MSSSVTFNIFRGQPQTDKNNRPLSGSQGQMRSYTTPLEKGMVVLDAVHDIQASQANDLAVRWNCKAGKCGSCSAEINGKPSLMCMTRMDTLDTTRPINLTPMHRFPLIKDLVTEVKWNYEVEKRIQPFKPSAPHSDGRHRMEQKDVERIQEFRKCIECFLCQDVCHVLRDHQRRDFIGPRYLLRVANLVMHPLDTVDRLKELKESQGIGFCNITKCCTEVCPENIHITDNAIIPLKERVAGRFYDPLAGLFRILRKKRIQQRKTANV